MRRKIWRMSEGQFSQTAPKIRIEPSVLKETIAEGDSYNGSFSVLCDEKTPAKGLVYSDHPYIYINTPAFNEENPTINFRIAATHLRAGDLIKGRFFIYSDATIQELLFSFEVVKKYPVSSYGIIDSIESFAELARRSWKEALEIFYTELFSNIIKDESKDIRLLYRAFSRAKRSDLNLEEFLTAAGLKERMTFDVDTRAREYSFVSGNRKESIDITRSTWGHISITVTSDADFVTVENNVLTNDFFLGSRLSLNYYIHKDLLHEGKNCCHITISGMGITKKVEIVASTTDLNETHHDEMRRWKSLYFDLYRTYEDFRLKKTDAQTWSAKTVELCDKMLNLTVTKDRLFNRLIKTHALIVRGERKLALEIIKNLRTDIVDKRSAEWAYLLYLGALLEPEEEYVTRLGKEIEAIQEIHPEDVRIFWFLLFIKKEYVRNNPEKLRAIRHWIAEGYDSPVLYAECFELFSEDTYLINSLDDINIKILSWAAKHDALSRNMAERIFDLLYKDGTVNRNIYDLLKTAYEIAPEETHLKAFISYLLRRGLKEEKYAAIYALGIEKNIRLTGLFESYIECLPSDHIEKLSSMVIRYFSYNTNVSVDRKALVYANIIMYKEDFPTYYDANFKRIQEFCIEQMKAGYIDNNIVICYQDCVDNGYIDSRMADGLQNIAHLKKAICIMKDARRIIAVEEELKEPVVSSIYNRVSYLPVYTKDYKVFVELMDGRLVTEDKYVYIEDTINIERNFDRIRDLSSDKGRFLISDLSVMEKLEDLPESYENAAREYLFSDDIDPDYLKKHFHIFMAYFKEKAREDVLLAALLHNDRYRNFDNNVLSYLASLLMIDGNEEKALSIFRDYIITDADKRQLLNLLKNVVKDPRKSRGEFILELCISLLREGYHSDETIEYLLGHFIGTLFDMRNVFKYANPDSPYFSDYCERFIVEALYTEGICKEDDDILIAYLDKNPNPMIVEAYISYFSHLYIKNDFMPPDSVFAILFRQLSLTDNINDACRFAYSKYLCTKKALTSQERQALDILIKDQLLRNIYFPFYSDMDDEMLIKYHLYDRMYACFTGPARLDAVLHIRFNEEDMEFDMTEVYPGIYVRDMMIFFGENLQYNVYERGKPDRELTCGEFNYHDVGILSESRFYLINHMEEALFYNNKDNILEDISSYHNMMSAQKSIFKTL